MRYLALLDDDRPIENPLTVVRIHDREEMYVPGRGWEHCDPLCRTWFVNVAITEEHALALLPHLEPTGPLEDRDPERSELSMYAYEGHHPDVYFYAIETGEHPFDDPLTVLRRHWLTGHECHYTTNLIWEHTAVAGRRIRITQDDAEKFKDIQALRVCGDTKYRYYAITNPFEPDVENPALVAREHIGMDSSYDEHYHGGWVGSGAIYSVRNGFANGELTPISPETAARLVQREAPRPERVGVRYFLCLSKTTPDPDIPRLLVRAREEPGGLRVAEYHRDGWYVGDMYAYLREHKVVEIDEEAARRLQEAGILDRVAEGDFPEG